MFCLFALDLNPRHWLLSSVCLPLVSNLGPLWQHFLCMKVNLQLTVLTFVRLVSDASECSVNNE